MLVSLLGMIALLVLCTFVLSLYSYRKALTQPELIAKSPDSRIISTQQEERMAQCRAETLGQIKPEKVDLKVLAGLHGLCYARVNEEDALAEFGIRRGAFLNQQSETGILMWMVVLITISGVLLAGVQLLAGFKLALLGKAAFDQGGQISLEANKLSVSSSVAGVLVLAISLCFFYVFSKEIYLIRVQGENSNAAPIKSVTSALDMKSGWDPATASSTQPPPFKKIMVPVEGAVAQEALRQHKSTGTKPQLGQHE